MTSQMRIEDYINSKKNVIERTLEEIIPPKNGFLSKIYNAMRYTLFSGGKRIRPILSLATYETITGKNPDIIAPIAASVELIHTYSLIHDDLPAMDNDSIRRGKPSNHIVFGEGMAILAGDGLLTEAFRIIAEKVIDLGFPPRIGLDITKILAEKAGAEGMVGGQSMDIERNVFSKTKETLDELAYRKTAALIECSVLIGGILSQASQKEMDLLSIYGRNIGIAFQIIDDIHDHPEENNDLTYPKILGLEEAKKEAEKLTITAKKAVSIFGKNNLLSQIGDYLLNRVN